jgi:hypothetical protein
MKNKRGQITLFIILGIVVLIIVLVAMFLINKSKEKMPVDPYKIDYDAKLAPIYNDVVYCIEKLGKEKIQKLGANGGFDEVDAASYDYAKPLAYDNNALELFPGSGIVIPYWTYIDSNPNCKECSYVQNYPRLTGQGESMQNSIETYVENNLVSCLDNFSAYKFDLDISYDALPQSTVEIRDENVFIGVDWKLKVKFPDESVSRDLSKFSATLDVRLKQLYDYALNILFQTEMLEESRSFEYFTKDIISFYSFGGQDAPIPPVSGPTVFQFTAPTIWLQQNVQDELKNAVSETIPYMQVAGTKDSFILITNDTIKDNFYANFQNVVYFDDAFASQIRVRFNYYPMWPFYVSVGPSDGPVIMPESSTVNLWIMKLSTTRYRFYYDVAYPVLVTLEDDSAFNGEGFMFNFPFEVNLQDNDPYSNSTIDMKEYAPQEETDDLGYTQRTVPVKLNVINGYTNLPMEDITVSYTCMDKEYIVGTSKIKDGNPNAIINSYLAPCIGGVFSITSFGYGEGPIYKDVNIDEPVEMDYPVYPAKDINLELRKRMYMPTLTPDADDVEVNRQWMLSSGEGYESSLDADEEVILIMSEIRSDGSNGNTIYFNSNNPDKTISLAPGKYSLEVISSLKMGEGRSRQNITIPGRTIKMKGDDVIINETVIQKVMYLGGLTLDDTTSGYVIIYPYQLNAGTNMIVYYPAYHPDDLKYIEDLEVLSEINNATVAYTGLFRPAIE